MKACLSIVHEFSKIGKPSDVAAQIKRAKRVETKLLEVRRKVAAAKIGKALEINPDVAYEMLKTMPVKSVISNLRKLRESADLTSRYKINEKKEESKTNKPSLSVVKGGQASELKGTAVLANSLFAGFHVNNR